MEKRGFERRHYTFVFALIVVALLGFAVGLGVGKKDLKEKETAWNMLQAEQDKKAADIKEHFPEIMEVNSFVGNVLSVSGSSITIKTQGSPSPFEGWPIEREVTIGPNTAILKQSKKDFNTYKKEIADSLENLQPGKIFWPPVFLIESPASASEIKVGDRILVYSLKNIKMETSFEASKITITESNLEAFPGNDLLPIPI